MGLLGILIAFVLLIVLAYRGWSILILAPAAALLAALAGGEPLLANWTQTFMGSAARFFAQFFPIFLVGALFGKLMEDSGSVSVISDFVIKRLGERRAILAVVLAGAMVTYGGVSLFVAFFILGPMAYELFRAANIPRRLMPGAIWLGSATFTFSALPGSPAIQNAIPTPHFGTTPLAAPGLGIIAAAIMLGLGMLWFARAESAARRKGEGFDDEGVAPPGNAAEDPIIREHATLAREFDPAEINRGARTESLPPVWAAFLPLLVVVGVNFLMSLWVLPHLLDFSFLAEPRWGATSLAAVAGVWSVIVAVVAGIVALLIVSGRRLPALRESMDSGVNASVLPCVSVASMAGFGAVIAALPAFALIRDWMLSIPGGPLVSLSVATNVLSSMTGSASAGMTIVLDSFGVTYLRMAQEAGINPELLHRVTVISSGTLDTLPHSGALITLLAVCGTTHRQSYLDVVMTGIVPAIVALVTVMVLGSVFGSF